MTDPEYRDKVVSHMAATTTKLEAIETAIARIESGAACPVGVRTEANVSHLQQSDEAQWQAIDSIRRPVRSAVIVSSGAGLTIGAIGRWIIYDILAPLIGS